MTIMPVFLKYPREGNVVGHLLAGYGELEYHMAECLSDHVHSENAAFRLMFSTRLSERARIDAVDSLIRGPLDQLGLGAAYSDAYGAMKHCAKIRNQYAHCHWTESYGHASRAGGKEHGLTLAFAQLEKRYENATTRPIDERQIDLLLLEEQEEYFCYTRDAFRFICFEARRLRGRLNRHPFEMPQKRKQPELFRRAAP